MQPKDFPIILVRQTNTGLGIQPSISDASPKPTSAKALPGKHTSADETCATLRTPNFEEAIERIGRKFKHG